MNHTLLTFARLVETYGLRKGVTYSFQTRQDANQACDYLRRNTAWEVLWVTGQQFEVR